MGGQDGNGVWNLGFDDFVSDLLFDSRKYFVRRPIVVCSESPIPEMTTTAAPHRQSPHHPTRISREHRFRSPSRPRGLLHLLFYLLRPEWNLHRSSFHPHRLLHILLTSWLDLIFFWKVWIGCQEIWNKIRQYDGTGAPRIRGLIHSPRFRCKGMERSSGALRGAFFFPL